MTGCLTGYIYDLLVDVMSQTTVQDPDSGAVTRKWTVSKTDIPGNALSVVSQGIGNRETWSDMFNNPGWTRLSVPAGSGITDRSRITNVRTSDGTLVYKESDASPTVFEVTAVSPETAPFLGYYQDTVLIERAEVQDA